MILSAWWMRQNNIKSGKTTVGELTKIVKHKTLPWCAESADRCGSHLKTCSGAENYEVTFMDFSFCSIWNHEAETGQNRLRETQHCRISPALCFVDLLTAHPVILEVCYSSQHNDVHRAERYTGSGIEMYSLSWNRIRINLGIANVN